MMRTLIGRQCLTLHMDAVRYNCKIDILVKKCRNMQTLPVLDPANFSAGFNWLQMLLAARRRRARIVLVSAPRAYPRGSRVRGA